MLSAGVSEAGNGCVFTFVFVGITLISGISCYGSGVIHHLPWLRHLGLLLLSPACIAGCLYTTILAAAACQKLYGVFRTYTDTRTLQSILQNPNAATAIEELHDYFGVKYDSTHYEPKVMSHRVVWMLGILQSELKNGGLEQYVGSYLGKHFNETRSVLTTIGADKAVQAMNQVEQYLGTVSEDNFDRLRALERMKKADPLSYERNMHHLTEELNRALPGACRQAVTFVQQHIDELEARENKLLKAVHRLVARRA